MAKRKKRPKYLSSGHKKNWLYIKLFVDNAPNPYERFLYLQLYIQFLLVRIVVVRITNVDNVIIEKLENETLGQLIAYFQSISKQREIKLIDLLRIYNRNRNEIIHKVLRGDAEKQVNIKARVLVTNNTGVKICKQLERILDLENDIDQTYEQIINKYG